MHQLENDAQGAGATSNPEVAFHSMLMGLLGPRGTRAAIVAGAVLGLSLLIVSGLPGRVRAWIHDRPEYLWTIDLIQLDPAPPSWLRPGDHGLLAAVSDPLKQYHRGSILELDLGAVERAFKNVYWVDRVQSVRRSYANQVVVSLDYRKPVAIATIERPNSNGPGPSGEHLVVDGNGLILDRIPIGSELARTFLSELVLLSGLNQPTSAEIGQPWPLNHENSGELRADPVAQSSARLAKYLLDRSTRDGWPETLAGRAFQFRRIHPFDGNHQKLYLAHELSDGQVLWVVWGAAPGSEGAVEPLADEKWEMLRNWVSSGGADRPLEPGALGFTSRGPVWLPLLPNS